jgi:mannosyltransferase OCH1-like enzyme
MAIPKCIYQSDSSSDLPQEILKNINKIKALNKNWEYRFFDDVQVAEFIRSNYDQNVVDLFERINPLYGAARADLFRYLLIYKLGGVWLDIKSSVNASLDEVIRADDTIIFSQWESRIGEAYQGMPQIDPLLRKIAGGELQQWHIIAEPRNPFIKAVINRVMHNIANYSQDAYGVGRLGVLRVTGPSAYTMAIGPILKKFPYRMADSNRVLKLDYSFYLKDAQKPSTGMSAHKNMQKNHYSKLSVPVVL